MVRVQCMGGTVAATILFVAVLFAGFFGEIPESVAQSGTIRNIDVEGNRRIEDTTVRSYMQIAVGDPYDPALVNDSLKALFDTGLFADVSIDRRGSGLFVQVRENPIINRVAFEGNRKFDDDTLAKEVQAKPRTVFTRTRVQTDVQRLLTIYRRSGRFAVSIEPKLIELAQDRVDLVFEIDEGPLTAISTINFIGNRAFSDSDLRDVVVTAQTRWWEEIIGGGDSYDPDKLNFDRELLRRHYLKNGYADFRIVSAVAELDREQQNFFITFTVDEGEQYRFGYIDVDSTLTSLPPDVVDSQILTYEGEVYNAELLDKTVENVTLEAGKVGFAFVEVKPRPRRNGAAKTIDITYLVDDGPRVYIERIDIYGNSRTHDYVIRREFRLAEGDAFNRALINKTRRDLLGLGFFSRVEIDTEQGSAPDRVIVKAEVEEKSTGELSFGAGFSSLDSILGEVSLTERNLLGRGQYLRLKGSLSGRRSQAELRFTEPFFLGRRVAFGFDLFATQTDSTDESSYESSQVGGGLRFGFPLHENVYFNTRYSYTRDELFGVNTSTASLAVQQAVGINDVSLVGYSLVFDTLDNPLKPTSGVKATVSQDFAGVGGTVNYVRSQANSAYFYQLMPDVVTSLRGSAGNITGWGGDSVRLLDSFYKGGETIRGFERSGIGPRDAATGDALGGKTFFSGSAEVGFPLGLPEELGITGAVFADAATLFDTDVTGVTVNDDSTIRASGGVSVYWDSPLGPLRFDFAEAFAKESYDRTEFFRFSGGVRF